ncbi:MAG: hypothetical protein SNJ66_02530 [Chloroherpetonaceae bacterium]
MTHYKEFQERFKLLVRKKPHLIVTTLSNIFTMRLIGNKTHGDLAEIGITEFINQYMYDYKSVHVGKARYRAKSHEEDISIINEITKEEFFVSLKAYGDGPLQLSTDKNFTMFPFLEQMGKKEITTRKDIDAVFNSDAFSEFRMLNVMPLIYDEKQKRCNIMIFNQERAKQLTRKIMRLEKGNGRKHPVYVFVDESERYICEVRYGNAMSNALQRGLWTHTKKAIEYFESITNGWIDYSENLTLLRLFSLALNASEHGHQESVKALQQDIEQLKRR